MGDGLMVLMMGLSRLRAMMLGTLEEHPMMIPDVPLVRPRGGFVVYDDHALSAHH